MPRLTLVRNDPDTGSDGAGAEDVERPCKDTGDRAEQTVHDRAVLAEVAIDEGGSVGKSGEHGQVANEVGA